MDDDYGDEKSDMQDPNSFFAQELRLSQNAVKEGARGEEQA